MDSTKYQRNVLNVPKMCTLIYVQKNVPLFPSYLQQYNRQKNPQMLI